MTTEHETDEWVRACSHAREQLLGQRVAILSVARRSGLSRPWTCQAPPSRRRALMELLGAARASRLFEIDRALERIDAGMFAVCDICGGRISLWRISQQPELTACSDCRTPLPIEAPRQEQDSR